VSEDAVQIWYGAGSWGTFQALCFLLSALFCDIFLVRLSLVMAYIFLIINICLGLPSVSEWHRNVNRVALGSLTWAVVTFTFQAWALAVLIIDDMPVRMSVEDHEVWRFFYRRCGMAQSEFTEVLKLGVRRSYREGDLVEERHTMEQRMHLILRGRLKSYNGAGDASPVFLSSGQVAGIGLGNLFGIYIGFDSERHYKRTIEADTDATVISWDAQSIMAMAKGKGGVAVPAYWRSFIMFSLAHDYCQRFQGMAAYNSYGEPEPSGWNEGMVPSIDFTEPLRPQEKDKLTLLGVLSFVISSLDPRPRHGLRHRANPKHGALAQSRVLLRAQMEEHEEPIPPVLQQAAGGRTG